LSADRGDHRSRYLSDGENTGLPNAALFPGEHLG
jgi:hypothetical protein